MRKGDSKPRKTTRIKITIDAGTDKYLEDHVSKHTIVW